MATKITTTAGHQPGVISIQVRKEVELEAEACDPYAMGWDAGNDLDDPPPCPFTDGLLAKLWRQGFSARVDEYIGRVKSSGGLKANIAK